MKNKGGGYFCSKSTTMESTNIFFSKGFKKMKAGKLTAYLLFILMYVFCLNLLSCNNSLHYNNVNAVYMNNELLKYNSAKYMYNIYCFWINVSVDIYLHIKDDNIHTREA